MSRTNRAFSQEFLEYQRLIVNHENFSTLPNKVNLEGKITWVRPSDPQRAKWWDALKAELKLKDRASVARRIHPPELGGLKPCQICGKQLSIFAVYPNSASLKKLNLLFHPLAFSPYAQDVSMIVEQIDAKHGKAGLARLLDVFSASSSTATVIEVSQAIIEQGKGLSPGVMSNAPDRLDGFHTYNACCRPTQDTGRSASNLARYSTDRRAYETWADGDWRGADRVMGLFRAQKAKFSCPRCKKIAKMSPDHIGPISLGFRHQMQFQPMCRDCNSSKNNRLTLADVNLLVKLERGGQPVISWHSEQIWNQLKPLVLDDASALRASVLMRRNLHHVLMLLQKINSAGFQGFLTTFLHPEYAAFDFEFKDFNPTDGSFKYSKYPVNSRNTASQAERYLRISFDSLNEYVDVANRNVDIWNNEHCDIKLEEILSHLESGQFDNARSAMGEFLKLLAEQAVAEFSSSVDKFTG